eukprot:342431-Amphidinium_carterae.1
MRRWQGKRHRKPASKSGLTKQTHWDDGEGAFNDDLQVGKAAGLIIDLTCSWRWLNAKSWHEKCAIGFRVHTGRLSVS